MRCIATRGHLPNRASSGEFENVHSCAGKCASVRVPARRHGEEDTSPGLTNVHVSRGYYKGLRAGGGESAPESTTPDALACVLLSSSLATSALPSSSTPPSIISQAHSARCRAPLPSLSPTPPAVSLWSRARSRHPPLAACTYLYTGAAHPRRLFQSTPSSVRGALHPLSA